MNSDDWGTVLGGCALQVLFIIPTAVVVGLVVIEGARSLDPPATIVTSRVVNLTIMLVLGAISGASSIGLGSYLLRTCIWGPLFHGAMFAIRFTFGCQEEGVHLALQEAFGGDDPAIVGLRAATSTYPAILAIGYYLGAKLISRPGRVASE